MSKTIAILQARMGSSRLPGKMLLPIIDGKGALELMLERASRASHIAKIVVATTTDPPDDGIEVLCDKLGVSCHRGNVEDVLDRFHGAISEYPEYDTVVRLTGDCPLHDPAVIDMAIAKFRELRVDYLSNVSPPTFPDGLDVEVFSRDTLTRAWREAEKTSEREHVTLFIRKHPEIFSIANMENPSGDLSHLRWTLDEKADMEFITAIFKSLYESNPKFGRNDVLNLLDVHPELAQINTGIRRNEGLEKSLEQENI